VSGRLRFEPSLRPLRRAESAVLADHKPVAHDAIAQPRAWLSRLWPKASLRVYLVAIMLIATVPFLVMIGYKIYDDFTAQRTRMWSDLERTAAATAQNVERELASTIDALSIIGQTTLASNVGSEEFEALVRDRPRLRPSWRGMFLIAANGDVVFDPSFPVEANAAGTNGSVRNQPDFRSMLAMPRPMVSNLLARGPKGPYITAVAVPVIGQGRLLYVVGAWIDVGAWSALLQSSGPPADGLLSIADRDHEVIARTKGGDIYVGQKLPASTIAAMGAFTSGTHRSELLEGEMGYSAWNVVPSAGWGVTVSIPSAPLDIAVYQAVVLATFGAALCMVLGLTLASIVARHLVQPLDRLSRDGVVDTRAPIVVREVADLRNAMAAAHERDIAARKRLQATADEFETLFNSSPIALAFAQDPQCSAVTNNAAMEALFGAGPAGDVRVTHGGELLPREQLPLQRAAASGEHVPPVELEITVDGKPARQVIAQAVPLHDAGGRPRGAIGAVVDITDRVRSEARLLSADQRLRESQHLMELAQEAGHVGFFDYHFERDQLNWSPGQAKLFGEVMRPGDGSNWSDWVQRINADDRARVEQVLRSMFAAARERETLEYRVTPPGDQTRWLSSRVVVVYGPDRLARQMIGVSVDVTDEKHAQRERAALIELERSARLQAEAANQAKDEFLAMLGHELRNPLSAIASAVEVLNRVEAGSEAAASARAIAGRQTRHLAHLMDDLLDVGRVISGKVLLSRRAVDFAVIAQRMISTLDVTGDAQRHVVELELKPAWIDADATRIEQVLSNLVTNALKYTPAGGRIVVDVHPEAGAAVLTVGDNGPGIPPTLLPRVFDLFVQGERTLDRRSGGLGIGLTLARRLVELHGGTIEATSSPQGSLFTVRLPLIDAPTVSEGEKRELDLRRRSVVLVEDNEDALESLRVMLELDGHTVVTARDGVSGLRTVLELRPDVAVVDVGLPGMTGLELAKRSRGAGYAGLMIAVSGYGREQDVRQARESGFDAHLVKPINASELQRLMGSA
jgi:signal transduction histidine kinase